MLKSILRVTARLATLVSVSLAQAETPPQPVSPEDYWFRAVANRMMRLSPAECDEKAGDFCQTLGDAVQIDDESRIRIVVKKPRLSAASRTINVSDSDRNGMLNELQDAVAELRNNPLPGGARLIVASGDYKINADTHCSENRVPTILCLGGLADVEIQGNNTGLKLNDPSLNGPYFENSQRVALRGFSFEWSYLPGVQAIVEEGAYQGATARLIRVIDKNWTGPFAEQEIDSILPLHVDGTFAFPQAGKLKRLNFGDDAGTSYPVVVNAAARTFYHPNFQNLPQYAPGTPLLILRNRRMIDAAGTIGTPRGHTIFARGRDVSDITIERVAISNAPHTAILFNVVGRGIHLKNVRVTPRGASNPSLLSARAAGIVIFGSEGDVVLEGSSPAQTCAQSADKSGCFELVRTGDDAFNIDGLSVAPSSAVYDPTSRQISFTIARSTSTPESYINSSLRFVNLRARDRFALITNGNTPIAYLRARKVSFDNSAGIVTLVCSAADPNVDISGIAAKVQSNARPVLLDLSVASSRTLIRNVRIFGGTARGLLMHSPNYRIENNLIEKTAASGIQARYSFSAFIEGPGGSNGYIRGNTIRDTMHMDHESQWFGAISIGTEGLSPEGTAFPLVQRVLLEGNTLVGNRGVAVEATASARVMLRTNKIVSHDVWSLVSSAKPAGIPVRGLIYLYKTPSSRLFNTQCPNGRKCDTNDIAMDE